MNRQSAVTESSGGIRQWLKGLFRQKEQPTTLEQLKEELVTSLPYLRIEQTAPHMIVIFAERVPMVIISKDPTRNDVDFELRFSDKATIPDAAYFAAVMAKSFNISIRMQTFTPFEAVK